MNSILADKGYPLYTKLIKDKSTIYIKNNIVLKNRGDKEFDQDEEVKNHNNIVIEDKFGYVDIFCSKGMEESYQRIKDILSTRYSNEIINKICIHVK